MTFHDVSYLFTEAEQSADPVTIGAALEKAKRLRVDPDLISSAEGILARPGPLQEMGILRFGLKHGVVIEERGGEALPIPYQDWELIVPTFLIKEGEERRREEKNED
eukprot:Skav234354  [mRNA]  locus=scaffold1274:105934:113069:+ [translate_table: standard]